MAVPNFVDDPFRRDINPGSAEGTKLFLQATEQTPEDEKFDISISSAQKFMDRILKDADSFGWASLVRTVQKTNGQSVNLLKNHKAITWQDIKRQAYVTWKDHMANINTPLPQENELTIISPRTNEEHVPVFYRRVKSRMIAKRVLGYLKMYDFETLKNKADMYTWTSPELDEFDGPTIIWILLQECNPSTRVGVSELKEDLRKATSSKFQHNVRKLTDYMGSKFREITERGQTHEDYILDIFNALSTVPNPDFASHVRDERKEWELGGNKPASQIIAEALTIYNNAVSANRWTTQDPKDSKIPYFMIYQML